MHAIIYTRVIIATVTMVTVIQSSKCNSSKFIIQHLLNNFSNFDVTNFATMATIEKTLMRCISVLKRQIIKKNTFKLDKKICGKSLTSRPL